ncbi:MAG: YcxB family protein [Pirellulales bacterium]|nr:YcxB family protein [Pirellulales bacterium]
MAMQRYHKSKLQVRRDLVAGIIALLGGLYLALMTTVVWLGWLLFVVAGFLLALVVYGVFVLPRLIYNSQPKLKNEYRLSFSDHGIGFQSEGIDSTLQWKLYDSWRFDPDFYILYHGKRDITVIPRRVLNSGDADRRFREMLERSIGPTK